MSGWCRRGILGVAAAAAVTVACGDGGSSGGGTGATGGTGGTAGTGGACALTLCSGACVDTQTDATNCGTCGTACPQDTTCQAGACKPAPGSFGEACTKNDDCTSQLCLPGGHCSKQCASASDCPPAPEWTCAPLPSYPDMCQCTSSGAEQCDGRDNDCDGVVDNGATCPQTGYTCQSGACACDPANLCGATCVDKQKDVNNCGGCATQCAAPTSACIGGTCSCPGGGIVCVGTCVPNDATNCGACGKSCATGEVCDGEGCVSQWADWRMPNPVAAGLPNPASYDTTTPGVVLDKVTGLMWQRAVDAGSYNWAEAKTYCANLALAGHSDWRLPTEIELLSLVDYTKHDPAIDATAFPGTPPMHFWSSVPAAGQPTGAWYLGFSLGDADHGDLTAGLRVRCVR